ncbi:amidohydrolase [Sinirhodobacter populi]|uniref:Amidohydrolase n=1 Tax=Paenirhodobacter populi TaxID=2306993 RepID=A0A443K1P0_9RHOB|nr:nitrilase-related carbon-nitrogen hydrolase [Sinirhodobacter populi]RWR26675.1 amidohydrolase [Sinirhodobacter populi]
MPVIAAAAVQFEPRMFEKERNIDRLVGLVMQAAQTGARLVTTPEMATTGYCWHDRAEIAPYVEPVPGPTTRRFAALAQELGCHIVLGMPEVDPVTDLYYNSAVLIGPEGVVGTHRKTHSYISEPKWSAAGNLGHQVFETPLGRVAMLICMDIHFIETARLVALGGADVICHISNWLAERTPAPYWINRAFENGCYLIESNRWGLERGVQFSGGSCIIGPDAEILSLVDGGDGIALAEIRTGEDRLALLTDDRGPQARRPDLYKTLMQDSYLWNPNDFFTLYGHRPRPEGTRFRAAVARFEATQNPDENLFRIAEVARAARREGAELIVFPERALTGPAGPAIKRDGPEMAAMAGLSAQLGLAIVGGFAEDADDRQFNAAFLAAGGEIRGIYRQVHLSREDSSWAAPGNDWLWVDLPFGRIGLLIGHDAHFPEAARILALEGCDMIAFPSCRSDAFFAAHPGTTVAQPGAIPTGQDPFHWHEYRVRAGENNVYALFANVGAGSGIFGPDTFAFPREEAILCGDASFVCGTIDCSNNDRRYPTSVVRRKDLVAMRLPHWYEPLVRTR